MATESGAVASGVGTTVASAVIGGRHNCFSYPLRSPRIVLTESSDHPLLLTGGATVWDDLRIPGLLMKLGSSAPDPVSFGPSGNLIVYGFNGAATMEQTFFAAQMPHSYKLGSNIEPHVHWVPTTTDSGNVVWQLEYSIADIGGTFPAPTTIAATALAAGGTAWVHKYSDFSAIDMSGISIVSAMIVGRLFRDPAHASDTYGADAGLLEVDFHFQMDTIGSRDEASK